MLNTICSYCKEPAAFTKEHLWPASLHKRLYAANKQTKNSFWLSRLQRDIPSEPQIRDVCAHCNNVVLSELDNYICKLFDATFINVLDRNQEVRFEFDYHLLKRWLLKMSYNSSRIHNSPDKGALEKLLPYILGNQENLGRSVQLFTLLVYPEEVDERTLGENSNSNSTMLFEPTMHRVGHMHFRVHGVGQKILRTVHLRSYSFFIAYWPPGGGRAEQDDFEQVFTACHKGAKILRPSQKAVNLVCDGMGAWQSFRESRSAKFSSDID